MRSGNIETVFLATVQWEDLLGGWPKHLATTICQMNDRILPSTGYSPRELLLGLVIEDHGQLLVDMLHQTHDNDVTVYIAFVDSAHADTFQSAVYMAAQQKARFDGKVVAVTFRDGDLVQVYNNKLDNTFEYNMKLLHCWSMLMHVPEKFNSSYTIETLEGLTLCCYLRSECIYAVPMMTSPVLKGQD